MAVVNITQQSRAQLLILPPTLVWPPTRTHSERLFVKDVELPCYERHNIGILPAFRIKADAVYL